MPSLESMPREIRDMIYQFCLCVEEVLVPYPGIDDDAYSLRAVKPTVTLLALNKKSGEKHCLSCSAKTRGSLPAKVKTLCCQNLVLLLLPLRVEMHPRIRFGGCMVITSGEYTSNTHTLRYRLQQKKGPSCVRAICGK